MNAETGRLSPSILSTGTEPNRRIVVAYSRYKNTEFEEK